MNEMLRTMDAYWRAANYLSVGQIYLLANPLLREPLRFEHVKPRLLGHWGTTPGLNFVYVHANRVIKERDLDAIFVTGPGHGGPGIVANTWLEGTYSEVYPNVSRDEAGMQLLFKQFSFPGGIPSHVAPETPGSIHEGGELGYSLSHAFGAAFDNPQACSSSASSATGRRRPARSRRAGTRTSSSTPSSDGAVLPILHLNGYKIAGPTVLARIPREELEQLLRGYGWAPRFVEGDDPAEMHAKMAAVDGRGGRRDRAHPGRGARRAASSAGPRWPMIVLRIAQGLDGAEEGGRRADRGDVPRAPGAHRDRPEREAPRAPRGVDEELPARRSSSTARALPSPSSLELPPRGDRRMSANPHANGGLLRKDLRMPDFTKYAVAVPAPGAVTAEATRVQGQLVRDVIALNAEQRELPHLQPGRDRVEPLERRLRGDDARARWPRSSRRTITSRPTDA